MLYKYTYIQKATGKRVYSNKRLDRKYYKLIEKVVGFNNSFKNKREK